MASDDTEIAPGEAGTPEGFAEVKAGLLNLTPLEVLKCLEKLNKHDQDLVVRALDMGREQVIEKSNTMAQIEALKASLDGKALEYKNITKTLETHTHEPNYTIKGIGNGGWISNSHQLDAYKYAAAQQAAMKAQYDAGIAAAKIPQGVTYHGVDLGEEVKRILDQEKVNFTKYMQEENERALNEKRSKT